MGVKAVGDGRVENAEATKIVEKNLVREFIDKAVDAPVMSQRQEPMNQKERKTVEISQMQYIGKIIDVPVAAQHKVLTVQAVQKAVEVPQVQFRDRVVDVPVMLQRQVPRERILERIVEETDDPVPYVKEKIIEVVQHGPQEHEQNCTGEHAVDVPVRVIKTNLAKKYLGMLAEIAEKKDDYEKSYEQFGKRLKLGIHKSFIDGAEVAKFVRFNTSKSDDEQTNLKGDIGRMKEGQHDIYHITGESIAVVSATSFWEYLRKKGHEVLRVADPVEEYAVHQLKEFDETKLKPTTKEGLDLGDQDEKKMLEELKIEPESLRELMKEALGDKVEEVIVSNRMVDSLRVLTMSEHGLSANMERIMKAKVPLDNSMHLASGSQQQLQEARQAAREEGRKEKSENVEGEEWETVVGKGRKEEERERKRDR